jgi:phospholipid/cholesterol/gamma-HCH transport system substrate-binding protein
MKNFIETITGAIVLIIAFGFVYFAYKGANVTPHRNGYSLMAKFDKADGINIGSEVRISGIKIGNVLSEKLDAKSFLAVVEFSLDKSIELPADSSAQIVSDGLLGGKYLSITPGADDATLKDGDEIHYTQSSVNIETLIGKMIFNSSSKDNVSKSADDKTK